MPDNIDIDTKIKFLSPIVSNIRHFENWYGGHFEKIPLPPLQIESGEGPTLKKIIGTHTRNVPNSVLVSQIANSK